MTQKPIATNPYHRPWCVVDEEELKTLRELERCMRDGLPDGSPRMICILERLTKITGRR